MVQASAQSTEVMARKSLHGTSKRGGMPQGMKTTPLSPPHSETLDLSSIELEA
jgi:hypothetical protein